MWANCGNIYTRRKTKKINKQLKKLYYGGYTKMKTNNTPRTEEENKKIITFYEEEANDGDLFWEDVTEELEQAGAVLCGNRDLNNYNYTDIEEINAAIKDRENYFINNDELIAELEKATGKKYTVTQIRGCCQRDYIYLFYVKNELTQDQINYIEDLFFGKYNLYYADDENGDGCGYLVTFSEYNNRDQLYKILAEQAGQDVKNIKIMQIAGYKQTPIYKEL